MQQDGEGPTASSEGETSDGGGVPPRTWRRLEATPVFDSRDQVPALGVRSVRAGFPRLVYTAGGYEIDLQIRLGSLDGRLRMVGQVLDGEFEPCSGWVVVEATQGIVKTDLDGCGHFSINGLTPGWHRIEVGLPNALITIPAAYL